MKNSNDFHLGVAIGGAVVIGIIGVWGIFATTDGWHRSDFIDILVAIGTMSAAVAAVWGVKAARRTQEREWQRQDVIRAAELDDRNHALGVASYYHMQTAAALLWTIVQEMETARRNFHVDDTAYANAPRHQAARDYIGRVATRDFQALLADSVLSFDDLAIIAPSNNLLRKIVVGNFSQAIRAALYTLQDVQQFCRTAGEIREYGVKEVARHTLIVAIQSEFARGHYVADAEQWEELERMVSFLYPAFERREDGNLTGDEVHRLQHLVQIPFQ